MIHSFIEVMVNSTHKIKKRLDLRLDGGSEVSQQIEDDPNRDKRDILIIVGEDLKGELEKLLNEGAEDLSVREAVEDLDDHVPELVLGVLGELRGGDVGEYDLEGVEVAFEEVEVLGGVGDLEAVADLHDHLEASCDWEVGLHEALGVELVVEDGRHGRGRGGGGGGLGLGFWILMVAICEEIE